MAAGRSPYLQGGLLFFAANLNNNDMVRSLPIDTSRWRILPAREVQQMKSLGSRPRSVGRAFLVVALTLSVASTAAVSAEDQDPPTNPVPPASPPAGGRDFLFGSPRGSVGLRGSWVFARAGSDLFEFVERHLTVDRNDFNSPAFAVDVGLALTPRVEVTFGVDASQVSIASEYRNLVDNNRKPITQDTRLREVNLAGGIRLAVTQRGRGISRFAWIPARVVPYVGAGGGALWYDFTQTGDFVDALAPAPQPIFTDLFDSKGWTPSAHAFGGVDIRLTRILFMSLEGRYLWASAKLGRDFQDFDPIDLAGFRLSAGVNLLF